MPRCKNSSLQRLFRVLCNRIPQSTHFGAVVSHSALFQNQHYVTVRPFISIPNNADFSSETPNSSRITKVL